MSVLETHLRQPGSPARRYTPAQRARLAGLAAVLFAVPFVALLLTDAVEESGAMLAPAVALVGSLGGQTAGAGAGLSGCAIYGVAGALAGRGLTPLALIWLTVGVTLLGAIVGRLSETLTERIDEAMHVRRDAETVEAMFRAVFRHALDGLVIFDDEQRILEANGALTTMVGTPRHELIGSRIGGRSPPERRARLSRLWRAFEEGRTLRGEYEFTTPDGVRRSVEFTATADFLPGRHLAVVRDCTERRRSQEALEQRASQQAAIADLGLLALGGVDPDELMDRMVGRVATALDVDLVWILERTGRADAVRVRTGRGWREGVVGRLVGGDGDASPAWQALATSEPVLLEGLDGSSEDAQLLREHDVVSGLSVTVRRRAAAWGVLGVYTRSHREFAREDANFLRAAANVLTMAIDRRDGDEELRRRSAEISRLAAERQRIVAEVLDAEDRTRERISQQLHDEVLQWLFVIRQDVAEAASRPERQDVFVRARDRIGQAIHELRATVVGLHPVVLEQGGLRSAVEAIARHQADLGRFEVTVDISGEADGELDRLVVSLVRELLSNVARHARARHARVTLRRVERQLSLEVADDGCGMDPAEARRAVNRSHIGLASAAQRVEALGGRFDVLSSPGAGTTVRAAIPLTRRRS